MIYLGKNYEKIQPAYGVDSDTEQIPLEGFSAEIETPVMKVPAKDSAQWRQAVYCFWQYAMKLGDEFNDTLLLTAINFYHSCSCKHFKCIMQDTPFKDKDKAINNFCRESGIAIDDSDENISVYVKLKIANFVLEYLRSHFNHARVLTDSSINFFFHCDNAAIPFIDSAIDNLRADDTTDNSETSISGDTSTAVTISDNLREKSKVDSEKMTIANSDTEKNSQRQDDSATADVDTSITNSATPAAITPKEFSQVDSDTDTSLSGVDDEEDKTRGSQIDTPSGQMREMTLINETCASTTDTSQADIDSDTSTGGIYLGDDYATLQPAYYDSQSDTQTNSATPAAENIGELKSVFTPSISDADISTIAALSKDDKDKIKSDMLYFDLRTILPLDRQRKGVICPVCGNGTGATGDGISINVDPNDNHYFFKCFKCGNFNGDLYSIIVNLNNLNKSDFNRVLAIGKKIMEHSPINFDLPKINAKVERTPEQIEHDKQFILDAAKNIEFLPDIDRRALSLETLQKFNCGYVLKWHHPTLPYVLETPRIIIPTSDSTYNAILTPTGRKKFGDKYKSQKVGNSEIFNFDSISADKINIVVEGEIDAMSIAQATKDKYNVAALGGTSNWNYFVQRLNDTFPADNRINLSFAVLLDNDDGGTKTAKLLVDALIQNDYPAAFDVLIVSTEKVDANDILINEGDSTLSSVVDSAIDRLKPKIDDSRKAILNPAEPRNKSRAEKDFEHTLDQRQLEKILYSPYTDAGNAERFLTAYHTKESPVVQYVKTLSRWMVFKPPMWQLATDSTNNLVTKLFIDMARQAKMLAAIEVKRLNEKEIEKDGNITLVKTADKGGLTAQELNKRKKLMELVDYLHNLENRKYYFPALETAKGYIDFDADRLNNYPYFLNCPNGIVDLTTGKLMPHNPKIYFTQCTSTEYQRGYRHELVDKFLTEILPDEETREYLLDYLAYCLTGSTEKEMALFLIGNGRNGKGCLTRSLQSVFGRGATGFSTTINRELILQGAFPRDANAPSPELAKLMHKRLAVIEELPRERKLDESGFKTLTGGDYISARFLNQNTVDFLPQCKLIISGNFMPSINDPNDNALAPRISIIKFTQQFTGNNCNPKLKLLLATPEAQRGLLSLVVDRCVDWIKTGQKLIPTPTMDAAKSDWLNSLNSNDIFLSSDVNLAVKNFLNNFCKRDSGGKIYRADLMNKFRDEYPRLRLTDKTIDRAIMSTNDNPDLSAKLKISYKRDNKGNYYQGLIWK